MTVQPLERQQPEPVPPGPPANRTAVKLETAVRWSIVGGFVLAIVYTLYFARSFLVPIFVALFLATLLRPFVSRLGRLGVPDPIAAAIVVPRSEEHTSELQSLMRISYAVFCLK